LRPVGSAGRLGRKENPYENNAAGPLCGYMGCAVSGRAKDEA
jgi:hypothetical protein